MLFVDLGLAVRLAGEVLRRDLLLRRRLLVVLAAHLQQIIYHLCYKLAPEKSIHLEPGCWLPLAAEMWASFTQPLRENFSPRSSTEMESNMPPEEACPDCGTFDTF